MTKPVDQIAPTKGASSAIWQGLRAGTLPLAVLVAMSVVAVLGAAVARTVTVGFFAQQQAALAVLVPALVLAIIGYVVAIARAIRRVAFWRAGGMGLQARSALWMLFASALLVAMPVAMAVLLPQQPAP